MISLFFPLLALAAFDYCSSPQGNVKLEKKIPIDSDVNFFIRSAPQKGFVGLATEKGNILVDVTTGKIQKVPGEIDPVPSPDGEILTVPETVIFDPKSKSLLPSQKYYQLKNEGKAFPIQYLLMDGMTLELDKSSPTETYVTSKLTEAEILKSGASYTLSFMIFYKKTKGGWEQTLKDSTVRSNYQSLGMRSGTTKSYRMLFEGANGLAFRDYQWNQSKTLVPLSEVKPLCGGISEATPMINRQADEFSSYEYQKGVTHVHSISEDGSKCEVVDSIPALVGKIDFSEDKKYLAFHIDKGSEASTFTKPEEKNNFGVYLYNRKTKALISVPTPADENAYYPVFLKDNKIAFVSVLKGKKSETQKFYLNVASLNPVKEMRCEGCYDANHANSQLAAALGILRDLKCSKDSKLRFKNGLASFSEMSPDQCLALANDCKDNCLADLQSKIQAEIVARAEKIKAVTTVQSEATTNAKGHTVTTLVSTMASDEDGLISPESWIAERVQSFTTQGLLDFCHGFRKANQPLEGGADVDKDSPAK